MIKSVWNKGPRLLMEAMLVYWGILALVLPVTTWDSQVYNLGRLAIIEKAGFWQGTAWNSVRQVAFPWSFDAVHYPFLKLGWGTALPNYLCFLGLSVILFQLISLRGKKHVAYWAILILLAMPTLMLQATSTKNDFVIVFGSCCWLYALVRFRERQNRFLLFAAALSLAFTIGSKTSAIPICGILTIITICHLWKSQRALLTFFCFFIPLLVLFGSTETYFLNWQLYHHPLGPESFISQHANHDGIRGAYANFIRYYFGNISYPINNVSFLEDRCRDFLRILGLNNVGYRIDITDQTMQFLRNGYDSGSDFGMIGFLAMLISSLRCLKPDVRNPTFVLAAIGFLQLAINAYFIAWMPWNARFLCGSFVAFGVAIAIMAFGSRPTPYVAPIFGTLIIAAVIYNPLLCQERNPSSIKAALSHRIDLTFDQQRAKKPVYKAVLALQATGAKDWFLVGGSNSWVLPFLTINSIHWSLTPEWNQLAKKIKALNTTSSNSQIGSNAQKHILVLDRELPQDLPYEIVKHFPQSTYILRVPS